MAKETQFPYVYLMRLGEDGILRTSILTELAMNSSGDTTVPIRYFCTQSVRSIEANMPGQRRFQWQFVGKQPIVFTIVLVLLAANIASSFGLAYFGKYLIPKDLPNSHVCPAMSISGIQHGVPDWICWYANRDIAITFILLALGALIMLIYHKNVERVR